MSEGSPSELFLAQGNDELKKLEPNSAEEKVLWAWLDQADIPIRTTLKRINKIAKRRFPQYKLQTVSSCSGHVQPDDSLHSIEWAPGLVEDYKPHLMFYTRNETHLPEITEFLKEIFQKAVRGVNEKFGSEVMSLDVEDKRVIYQAYTSGIYGESLDPEIARKHPRRKTYSIFFQFPLREKQNVFPILSGFWNAVSESLTEVDNLHIPQSFQPRDFYRSKD